MTQTYVQRKTAQPQQAPMQKPAQDPAAGFSPAFDTSTYADAIGHPADLPGAIREKFENAFGADLSAVRVYRSQAVADAGAQAVAMGDKVVFAPGMLDFSSREGLTLLGHEMSHVVSQQRGEVTGSGFLNDPALEARADREGAMAAAGQQIAAPTAAMSSAAASGASGPMQAKKDTSGMVRDYNAPAQPTGSVYNPNLQTVTNPNVRGASAVADSDAPKKAKYYNDYVKIAQHSVGSPSKFADTHFARVSPKKLTSGTWGGNLSHWANGITGGLGVLSGGMTAFSSGASAIRNYQNLDAGASKLDVLEDGLTSLGGVGTMGVGAVTLAKGASSGFASMLQAGGNYSGLLPGLAIGTGAVNAGVGLMQAVRGGKRWYDISQTMKNMPNRPNADQELMKRTMLHGIEIQKRNTANGIFKTISGGLQAAGGALTMGGVTSPLGFGLSAGGALVSGIGSIYNLWKNRRLRRDAIAQELGGKSYKETLEDIKTQLKPTHGHISDITAWKIYLQKKGINDEKAKYDDIRRRRAAHMMHMAQSQDQTTKNMAEAFIESMGVHKVDTGGGIMEYADGALELLTDKLK